MGSLILGEVQVRDSGNYTCTASNGGGLISTTTELLVRGKKNSCLNLIHPLSVAALCLLLVTESNFSRPGPEIIKDHPEYEKKLSEYTEPVERIGKQWKLCWRASDQYFNASEFHAACDNKGPTVTLVKVGNNVFGGYTDKSWNGTTGKS